MRNSSVSVVVFEIFSIKEVYHIHIHAGLLYLDVGLGNISLVLFSNQQNI